MGRDCSDAGGEMGGKSSPGPIYPYPLARYAIPRTVGAPRHSRRTPIPKLSMSSSSLVPTTRTVSRV